MFWALSIIWSGLHLAESLLERSDVIPHFPIIGVITLMWGIIVIYFISGINVINEWERRPVLFFGKYAKTSGPGFAWIEPILHRILDDVSVQDIVVDLEVENVQTLDNVRLQIVAALTTRIFPDNVRRYVVEVKGAESALTKRAITAMTEIAAQSALDHILEKRIEFLEAVRIALQSKISGWGIEVKALEIKDLQIADEKIEQAIAMKARAKKEAEAELMRAEKQMEIARALKDAAQEYDEQARWLKGIETLIELTRSANNNTVIVPTELLATLTRLGGNQASIS